MSALNWGMIRDGGVFESLVHAILGAEDPGVVLFGRPGKDSGQDARSGDGRVVYQAKYGQSMTIETAARLAIEELAKIAEYREAGHPNSKHWQAASEWVLVGNFEINPNDEERWQSKVVPGFRGAGLSARYWSREVLDQKLIANPQIREVFFQGENRVLVGLREAHELLVGNAIGAVSLSTPMVGRAAEMQAIKGFVESQEKRILPIVGSGGIGKSRLLYESLVSLGEDGWRVFWALPEAMARSSRWFYLLNGIQRTCIAIDDPDDPGLLRAVVEQLASSERRNWKVLIACRSEKSDMLQRFKTNSSIAEPLVLAPLSEASSKELVRSNMSRSPEASFLHEIYKDTRGVPVWLCLIADLANRQFLKKWPETSDQIAASYVSACMERLKPEHREGGTLVLRWLSLWGGFVMDANDCNSPQMDYLVRQGLQERIVREIIAALVAAGIVDNWGFQKRLYAIQPMVIREHVLAAWLFKEENGTYRVNLEGRRIIDLLVSGECPEPDRALRSLSHLTQSRLEESNKYSFLRPVFEAMLVKSREGNVIDQQKQLELLEKIGATDPEKALEVLRVIRQTEKADHEVEVPSWGKFTTKYSETIAKIPEILSGLTSSVADRVVAKQYLEEFRWWVQAATLAPGSANIRHGGGDHLKRLLRGSKNAHIFASPAAEIVRAELGNQDSWPFVGILLANLIDPEHESSEWVSDWTLSIGRSAIAPGGREWKLAAELRDLVFEHLKNNQNLSLCCRLWAALAESHDQYHRMILHAQVRTETTKSYRSVLVADLQRCQSILSTHPATLTVEEVTSARKLWDWHLDHDNDEELISLAQQCESIHNSISPWRLHDFFRFATESELRPETQRIAELLRSSASVAIYEEFFAEASRYLRVARAGGYDGADTSRMYELAASLLDLFALEGPANLHTSFVCSILRKYNSELEFRLEYSLAIRTCQLYLKTFKDKAVDETQIAAEFERLVGLASSKALFIFNFYASSCPGSVGKLTEIELRCILGHEAEFEDFCQLSVLLGEFALVSWGAVESCLDRALSSADHKKDCGSRYLRCFIEALDISVLRYKCHPIPEILGWLLKSIADRNLNGDLLGFHRMENLRDRINYRMTVQEFIRLLQSRVAIEGETHRDPSFRLMPYDFVVTKWCFFDENRHEEVVAFQDLCRMTLVYGFTADYWIPKYVTQPDPTGQQVALYVRTYLESRGAIDTRALCRIASLASAYPHSSEAWAAIARPICKRAQPFNRDDREQIYFGLSWKNANGWSGTPGEVPAIFRLNIESAGQLLVVESLDSPLREFREWALRVAEADFEREAGRVEEDAHG